MSVALDRDLDTHPPSLSRPERPRFDREGKKAPDSLRRRLIVTMHSATRRKRVEGGNRSGLAVFGRIWLQSLVPRPNESSEAYCRTRRDRGGFMYSGKLGQPWCGYLESVRCDPESVIDEVSRPAAIAARASRDRHGGRRRLDEARDCTGGRACPGFPRRGRR